jgi:hypothetical protein
MIPHNLRSMIVNDTHIGEQHRWMYDRYGLTCLLRNLRFEDLSFRRFDDSAIPGLAEDRLDSNTDGSAYKNSSLYCEAHKPTK